MLISVPLLALIRLLINLENTHPGRSLARPLSGAHHVASCKGSLYFSALGGLKVALWASFEGVSVFGGDVLRGHVGNPVLS